MKSQVRQILEQYPETRNSDIGLTIQIWKSFYGIGNSIELRQLYDLPREDNVKRIRAKFNEQGLFPPTSWEVAKRRGYKELEWRRAMGYHTPPDNQEAMW